MKRFFIENALTLPKLFSNGIFTSSFNNSLLFALSSQLSPAYLAEYIPGLPDKASTSIPESSEIDKEAIVPSTIAKELGLYVVYYSPMQMAADLPKHYKKHMEAFQFIKNVPVNWEKKKILNSKISKYVSIARKDIKSDNWYLGGISDEKERNFTFKLDFLDKNKNYLATIYSDTQNTHWKKNPMEYEIKKIKVDQKSNLDIYMAPGGGFAIEIEKIN